MSSGLDLSLLDMLANVAASRIPLPPHEVGVLVIASPSPRHAARDVRTSSATHDALRCKNANNIEVVVEADPVEDDESLTHKNPDLSVDCPTEPPAAAFAIVSSSVAADSVASTSRASGAPQPVLNRPNGGVGLKREAEKGSDLKKGDRSRDTKNRYAKNRRDIDEKVFAFAQRVGVLTDPDTPKGRRALSNPVLKSVRSEYEQLREEVTSLVPCRGAKLK